MAAKTRYVVDTREQQPLIVATENVFTKRQKLDCGDYSIVGYQKTCVVEWKTVADFCSWIATRGLKRFHSQLERLKRIPHKCVLVGGPIGCITKTSPISHRTSMAATSAICAMGIPVIHCDGRDAGEYLCKQFLCHSRDLVNHEG